MTATAPSLGVDVGKRAIALLITVLVLWIVHQIAASLPMLQHALPIAGTGILPLALTLAIIDTVIIVALIQFGVGMSALLRRAYPSFPDLGHIVNLVMFAIAMGIAYKAYDWVLLPLFAGGSPAFGNGMEPMANAYMQAWQHWAQASGIAVPPMPFLANGNAVKIYDAIFLVLIAAPLVAVVVLVLRNMNAISEFVFHSGAAVASGLASPRTAGCAKCGAALAAGAGFCSHCGASTASSPPPPTTAPVLPRCPNCGAEHGATAKFCKQCGGALAAAK